MWILLIALLYFIPALNAYSNKKRNVASVLIINLFLGWTVIGWIVAFAMSAGKDSNPTVVVKNTEKKSTSNELIELHTLKEKGVITHEEFEAGKKKILG